MAGQVFAVASGKGGVGKTTTVVNLGVVLRRADYSVALVDADLGMANLATMLGVHGERTLHDVLAGDATVEAAVVEEAPGFAVLPGSEDLLAYADADPVNLADVLETLAASYDFVIVDTGAGMSHEDVLPLGLADRVILVSSPDPAAIGDTRKTAELAGLADGAVAGLVVTKADANTDGKHVAAQVSVDLLGVIPYDPTVRQSTAEGRPLEAVDPDTPAAEAYRALADALADGDADPLREPAAAGDVVTAATDAGSPEGSTANQPTAEVEGADDSTDVKPDQSGAVADAASEPEPAEPERETVDESPAEATDADDASAAEVGGAAESEEVASDVAEAAEADAEVDDTAEADDAEVGEVDTEEVGEVEEDEEDVDEAEEAEADEADADEEEEDYLAEWEDEEPESKGGLLSRLWPFG